MSREFEVSDVSVIPKTAELLLRANLALKKTEIPGQQRELIIPKNLDGFYITSSIVIAGFEARISEDNLRLIIGYRYKVVTPEQARNAFAVLASRMSTYQMKCIKPEFLDGVDSATMQGILISWDNKKVSDFVETFLYE